MSHTRFLRSLALAAVVLVTAGAAAGQQSAAEKLGTVNFPVACSPAAQAEFARSVAALHSFWFDTARTAFEAVAAADPSCGMASRVGRELTAARARGLRLVESRSSSRHFGAFTFNHLSVRPPT